MSATLTCIIVLIVALLCVLGSTCRGGCQSDDPDDMQRCRVTGGCLLTVVVILMIVAMSLCFTGQCSGGDGAEKCLDLCGGSSSKRAQLPLYEGLRALSLASDGLDLSTP